MKKFANIFESVKPLIAMIHVTALPGTPKNNQSISEIIDSACREAEMYKSAGVDSVMIENMHDVPYLKRDTGHEITAAMAVIGREVKRVSGLPVGMQILAAANKQALAAGLAAGVDFIRAEGFVFAHTADEGIIESGAGELLRYRKQISAENVAVLTDIKKKHSSHSLTADTGILETAKAAEFFLSDGVIVTGSATGEKPAAADLNALKNQLNIPVIIGSGLTADNIESYFELANGFIVGSYFKTNGNWQNSVDPERVKQFLGAFLNLRCT